MVYVLKLRFPDGPRVLAPLLTYAVEQEPAVFSAVSVDEISATRNTRNTRSRTRRLPSDQTLSAVAPQKTLSRQQETISILG
jgi:hypothetical protein